MNVRLSDSELRYAEPSADTEPFELGARDHELLRKAVLHYMGYLDAVSREVKHFGGMSPLDMTVGKGRLDGLYDLIIKAHVITITPDE